MKQVLEAIYEKGIFRPLESPELPEGKKVRLELETSSDDSPDDVISLAASVYQSLSAQQIAEVETISLNRQKFFRR